ncbi:hypothetical protein PHLGIDRAFT_483131 [Phlebiopsis gigantea 11061_1 CR5-6]|uniref:Uncharacterized protein n=1 Tax=Phlebiopsis gigantea (strain 11061_1 CR5-6) TaxID=745531 RepID=A0A0C3S930_PHLG1|nr:hypothetical protein PHLGIDRAFT_483131 [Phlebiopsis gigantea 11061_1 CR5-6]
MPSRRNIFVYGSRKSALQIHTLLKISFRWMSATPSYVTMANLQCPRSKWSFRTAGLLPGCGGACTSRRKCDHCRIPRQQHCKVSRFAEITRCRFQNLEGVR